MSQLISQGARAITKSQMVDRINDIAWQAHQGSVAAIIQLLNEKLAKSGVRTRAIFADGVLQLLCEAAREEQLEQSSLVEQIQQILNSITPRNIRRVNINSRIVREEQLLWLTEIYRDRDHQLLWSQEITLTQPHIFKQLIADFQAAQTQVKINLPQTQFSRPSVLIQNSSKKRILAATGLSSLLLLAWLVYAQLGDKLTKFIEINIPNSLNTVNGGEIKPESLPLAANYSVSAPVEEPFSAAVRIANIASARGKIATTSTQWLELAAQWQRASDLMNMVPPDHSRYQEAKIRTQLYKQYSDIAQEQAQKTQF
ncbi:hypothetical protein [Nodularia sphaerocarpa]|uniref:hypothetical protein n=1 Tax=Nodularia sphaerocarpa TaxID=137816 RepID=UPI001EFB6B54|nr:hypothetical protein [Nodularia sphaerocarpa]MDB9372164.1 hypothetical protein [Nodularia sphaerocarpa CS-585]MDB9379181.1 hypothetical protein [Nodularia sphaerocarpa CS-585A2]ULP70820.1 hypothetical protein BDGGKGIB_00441 [Nodularia sphaerocarpa UHCC 0038]